VAYYILPDFAPLLANPNPGILGFKNQKSVEEIQLPAKDWNPESQFSMTSDPESTMGRPESKTILDYLLWGDIL